MSAPFSATYNEPYWIGGAAEKTHVFLQGNNLPQRMGQTPFTVAELGFGTGLNLLLTAQLAEQNATPLIFISYELHPIPATELACIQQEFPTDLQPLSQTFLKQYNPHHGWNTFTFATTTLHLFIGDAAEGILTHPHPADAWFLDGFSPATNPDMWTPELLAHVYRHTKPGGTASTYSVARTTKDALAAAGFHYKRAKGFPPKWHMLKATKA
jgi:tRNA U34 5-methylaminomethyl-2-thiouridine-forming methyltransferase MnmC